jgi:hypothetical protein
MHRRPDRVSASAGDLALAAICWHSAAISLALEMVASLVAAAAFT